MLQYDVILVQKSFHLVDVPGLQAQQARLMKSAANSFASKARFLSAQRPAGSLAPGFKTRRLQTSIKSGTPRTRSWGNGMRMELDIFADLNQTRVEGDDSGFSYAVAQEYGTGLWGKKRRVIKPKRFTVMKWRQEGYAYRGPKIQSKLISFELAAMKHANPKLAKALGRRATAKQRRINRVYLQFAEEVKGVHGKHFMRDGMKDPPTIQRLKEELDALHKQQVFDLRSIQFGLVTPGKLYQPAKTNWPRYG